MKWTLITLFILFTAACSDWREAYFQSVQECTEMINQYDAIVDSLERVQPPAGEAVQVIYDYGALDAPPVQNQVKLDNVPLWPDPEPGPPGPSPLRPLNKRISHYLSNSDVQLWLTVDTRLNSYRDGHFVQSVQLDSVQFEQRTVVQLDTVEVFRTDVQGSIIWGAGTAVAGFALITLFAWWGGWPWR